MRGVCNISISAVCAILHQYHSASRAAAVPRQTKSQFLVMRRVVFLSIVDVSSVRHPFVTAQELFTLRAFVGDRFQRINAERDASTKAKSEEIKHL